MKIPTIESILNELPSGSGFDCEWDHLKTQKNGLELFETYFHNMNNDGYYDGFTRLRLKIDLKNLGDFRLGLTGKPQYHTNRDYFEDTIYYSLTGEA